MDSKTEISFNELKKAVDKFVYDTTRIVIANGLDLLELDMKEIPNNVFFLSNMNVERGTMYEIVDSDLKLELFEFCTENKDRCFQGLRGSIDE